jgi:hypothetical protein
MRFLDIDLDFFLSDIAHHPPPGRRLSSRYYQPWNATAVRHFLEKRCGLSRAARIPGRFVRDHDGAFDYWHELARAPPSGFALDVAHVDAHADLGLGDGSWVHLMTDVLHRPVADRPAAERGPHQLSLASYLAYAAACRWLASVEYVHPTGEARDLAWLHFKGFDTSSGFLQLKAYSKTDIDACSLHADLRRCPDGHTPAALEPPVPFNVVPGDSWITARPFERALLCQSPEFTPRASDRLISIFCDYIDFR